MGSSDKSVDLSGSTNVKLNLAYSLAAALITAGIAVGWASNSIDQLKANVKDNTDAIKLLTKNQDRLIFLMEDVTGRKLQTEGK